MDVRDHLNLVVFKDRVNEAARSVSDGGIGAGSGTSLCLSKKFSEGSR